MGVMDAEKSFEEEAHYMYKNRIGYVLENINKRFHGYYADNRTEAVDIVKLLIKRFDEELGGGKSIRGGGFAVGSPDWGF